MALLQSGEVNQAQDYVARVDLLNQAFEFGMATPGDWMAVYVNDLDREIQDDSTSLRVRFFDNAERNRSYEATFEQDPETGQYRLMTLEPVVLAASAGLVTPAPPRPTITPTVTPTTAGDRTVDSRGARRLHADHPDYGRSRHGGGEEILNPTLEPTPTATPTFTPTPTDTPTNTPSADRHADAQRDADPDADRHRDAHAHAHGEAAPDPHHSGGRRGAPDGLYAADGDGPAARRPGHRIHRHRRPAGRHARRDLRDHRGG